MKRGYNLVAHVYDKLAKLFIGKALRKAQTAFLPFIPQNANVLVVGGGTGWILEEITKIHPQSLCIDYVDISSEMIALSKKRNTGKNEVSFIQKSIIDFASAHQYNIIITPFLLDNFKEETAQKVFAILHHTLKENGLWLYTDFQVTSKKAFWQKAVLFVMYSFFRIVCHIEAKKLPDVVSCFENYPYHLLESKTFLHEFIVTSVYRKTRN